MPALKRLNRVKELLAGGKTEAAADLLMQLSKTSFPEYYHSALLLKNRIETLQQNVIEGVIGTGEQRIEWARISKGIVELVEQIDKGERPVEGVGVGGSLQPPPKRSKWFFGLLIILPLLLGAWGFWYWSSDRDIKATGQKEKTAATVVTKEYKGRLLRPNGLPAPKIRMIFEVDGFKKEITTDAAGKFAITLPAHIDRVPVSFYARNRYLLTRSIKVDERIFRRLEIPD